MKPKIGSTGKLLPFFKQKAASKNSGSQYLDHPFNPPNQDDKTSTLYIVIGYLILILLLSLSHIICSYAQTPATFSGRVTDEKGEPLAGAIIRVKGQPKVTSTGKNGEFSISQVSANTVLIVSFIGYKKEEISLKNVTTPLAIILQADFNQLEEVAVSTGYQTIPKERATGSFSKVNNDLFNRRVSTDILSRLEDVVPGLVFNRNNPTTISSTTAGKISIRGQSTISGNADPLIVIDNFPYDGDPDNINPNDVESITVLKDAAAASIWGAKAGNGVIVITTKKGNYKQPDAVTFNSNVTIGNKPDLFYQPQMSPADFIEMEKTLFARGYYTATETSSSHAALTPAVELLIAKRNGTLSDTEADRQIEALKQYDTRSDLQKYFYRQSLNQQYSLGLSGGSDRQRYYLSAGLDKNLNNKKGVSDQRISINASNTYALLDKKLEISGSLYFSKSNTEPAFLDYNPGYNLVTSSPYYPYARLADDSGKPLAVTKSFRQSFIQSAEAAGLRDWQYRPLQELELLNNHIITTDYRLNASASYKIFPYLTARALYVYERTAAQGRNLQPEDSYFTRTLYNSFTQVSASGVLSHPVPEGAILDLSRNTGINDNLRGQLDFNKVFAGKHEVSAIAGYEVRELKASNFANRVYGYDDAHATGRAVSYQVPYAQYYSAYGSTEVIPYTDSEKELTDRYRSYYANASYTLNRRYIFSGSARVDQSNLFGVKQNQKGVPLYSAGIAWNLSDEAFYHFPLLPYLKLRLTYGYNGNVYKNVSAYTTATSATYYSTTPNTGLTYAIISNPPNPELRWEKVEVINAGVDFASGNNRVEGSVEYYTKKGIDLIGSSPVDPTTGVGSFTGNNASTKGQGIDLTLSSKNLRGTFSWNTAFLFSYNTDKVTSYKMQQIGYNYPTTVGAPLEGKPLFAIYSYRWAGLEHDTGDPLGYVDGQVSKDYASMILNATPANLVYNGPARPAVFGALRNTFSWKRWSFSAGVSYRLGYYFRKNTVNYSNVLQGTGGHGDYSLRWKAPGDEVFTDVPSLPAAINGYRDAFYMNSELLAGKGDHIRFQDASLAYTIEKGQKRILPFSRLQLYAYANNLVMIWAANKWGIDPDYQQSGPPPRTVAFGVKMTF